MSQHSAQILWTRGDQAFTDNRYSRVHHWSFDGGLSVVASASPLVVPLPMSSEHAVDPEEAFVASLASCHMLWFLSLAAKQGFIVDEYRDQPVGTLGRNPEGKMAVLTVDLRPSIRFSGSRLPTPGEIDDLHHRAHDLCFLANSVKAEVRCSPGS